MSEVTRVLSAIDQGDKHASEQLLPLVYEELRRLAARHLALERPGLTLQSTALVHEAYLRLVGSENAQKWDGRGHFFAAAVQAMRRVLVEAARRKGRCKHGGGFGRALDADEPACPERPDQIVALDEALIGSSRRTPKPPSW